MMLGLGILAKLLWSNRSYLSAEISTCLRCLAAVIEVCLALASYVLLHSSHPSLSLGLLQISVA